MAEKDVEQIHLEALLLISVSAHLKAGLLADPVFQPTANETMGLLISQLSGGQIQKLEVKLQGEFVQHPSQPLIIASLKGLLSKALGDRINYVNASLEADSRGIKVVENKDEARPEFASGSLQLTTYGDNGDHSVAGSIFADGELRIISIDQYPVNVSPSRYMSVSYTHLRAHET